MLSAAGIITGANNKFFSLILLYETALKLKKEGGIRMPPSFFNLAISYSDEQVIQVKIVLPAVTLL